MTEAAEWVTIKKFCEMTGYSEKGVRGKIARRDWEKGQIWTKTQDTRILLNLKAYYAWVEKSIEETNVDATRPATHQTPRPAILRRIRA